MSFLLFAAAAAAENSTVGPGVQYFFANK